ncbi:MAG: hypothetical protein ACRDHZ_11530 [Ktedonobacteraceae bacterium]
MYKVPNDFWDNYFRHKKVMRTIGRVTNNSSGTRSGISAGAEYVTGRSPDMRRTVLSNASRMQDKRSERNYRR